MSSSGTPLYFRKQESKHQKRPKPKKKKKNPTKETETKKKFICISRLLLLDMESVWSVDIPTYTPLPIAVVSHFKSSRNWEDLEELEGKEYDPNLLFERNNGT